MFTIVGFPSDVRDVILNPATGVLAGLKPGGIIVDMTTSDPSLAQEIAAKAKEVGVASIDAPVSGGDIGARNATLSIMCGGESSPVQPLSQPAMEASATRPTRLTAQCSAVQCSAAARCHHHPPTTIIMVVPHRRWCW